MFSRALDRLEECLIATLIAAATLVILVAVLHRYGAGLSANLSRWATAEGITWLAAASNSVFRWFLSLDLSWAQELCIFMFVWMAKFGAAYGVRTGIHVGVDVAVNQLRTPSKYFVVLFGLCCGAFFTFVVGSFGARFVWRMFETGQTSSDLEAPMWIVYLAVPLGSYLMCFRFVQVARSFARTGEVPHTNEAHVAGLEKVAPIIPGVDHQGAGASPAQGRAR
jgi:C4-dicarboxylate transporter DctM subunit